MGRVTAEIHQKPKMGFAALYPSYWVVLIVGKFQRKQKLVSRKVEVMAGRGNDHDGAKTA